MKTYLLRWGPRRTSGLRRYTRIRRSFSETHSIKALCLPVLRSAMLFFHSLVSLCFTNDNVNSSTTTSYITSHTPLTFNLDLRVVWWRTPASATPINFPTLPSPEAKGICMHIISTSPFIFLSVFHSILNSNLYFLWAFIEIDGSPTASFAGFNFRFSKVNHIFIRFSNFLKSLTLYYTRKLMITPFPQIQVSFRIQRCSTAAQSSHCFSPSSFSVQPSPQPVAAASPVADNIP